jgi:transcriptional regulator with XRE-family HTH domain
MPANEQPHLQTLPDLKQRIEAILKTRDYSYKALVDHLGTTEEALDKALAQSTIEIRTLEHISKALRIPLYSFFRTPHGETDEEAQKNFYNTNIWASGEMQLRNENEALREEIDKLRLEVAKKEILIQGLEDQLKARI